METFGVYAKAVIMLLAISHIIYDRFKQEDTDEDIIRIDITNRSKCFCIELSGDCSILEVTTSQCYYEYLASYYK